MPRMNSASKALLLMALLGFAGVINAWTDKAALEAMQKRALLGGTACTLAAKYGYVRALSSIYVMMCVRYTARYHIQTQQKPAWCHFAAVSPFGCRNQLDLPLYAICLRFSVPLPVFLISFSTSHLLLIPLTPCLGIQPCETHNNVPTSDGWVLTMHVCIPPL